MKKKTFIFMITSFLMYLILVLGLSFIKIEVKSFNEINIMYYLMLVLSQMILAGLLIFGSYLIINYRNKLIYKIIIPLISILIFSTCGAMVIGTLLKKPLTVNNVNDFTLNSYRIGEKLFNIGSESLFLFLPILGVSLLIYESIKEKDK